MRILGCTYKTSNYLSYLIGHFFILSQISLLCVAQTSATKSTSQSQSAIGRYYAELQKHAQATGEKVEERKVVFKDGASVVVRHYPTDHCTEIIKTEGNAPPKTLWLYDTPLPSKPGVHPSAKAKTKEPQSMLGKPSNADHSVFLRIAYERSSIPKNLNATLFQLTPPPPGPGNCYGPPHPGLPTWVANYPDYWGNQTIFGTFPDGCQFWQAHNVFSGAFGPVNWTYCVHN